PDGPTHHGMFDIGYMRVFPNLVVMAPGDAYDLPLMLDLALAHTSPSAIRYPKDTAKRVEGERTTVELGRAEIIRSGRDGCLLAYGTLLPNCLQAADRLQAEGLDVGVVNARFVKPIDREVTLRILRDCPFVVTVEEGALPGGYGGAVLEEAAAAGVSAAHV